MNYALLIDDEPNFVDSYRTLAETAGHKILTASSWDEGLAMFQVHAPTLVIADYNLPGSQHGLQLLAAMRRLMPSVRLVLMSAYISDADVSDIEGIGIVDRAIPKAGSKSPTEAFLEEVEAARARAETPTDWADYATARRQNDEVSDADLTALDDRLRRTRGIQ